MWEMIFLREMSRVMRKTNKGNKELTQSLP
jgi:Rod binding domain-containing protein